MTIIYMNVPLEDHSRRHFVSISWDIIVSLLKIPIIIDFYQ